MISAYSASAFAVASASGSAFTSAFTSAVATADTAASAGLSDYIAADGVAAVAAPILACTPRLLNVSWKASGAS